MLNRRQFIKSIFGTAISISIPGTLVSEAIRIPQWVEYNNDFSTWWMLMTDEVTLAYLTDIPYNLEESRIRVNALLKAGGEFI